MKSDDDTDEGWSAGVRRRFLHLIFTEHIYPVYVQWPFRALRNAKRRGTYLRTRILSYQSDQCIY